jgi:hypothetical protein
MKILKFTCEADLNKIFFQDLNFLIIFKNNLIRPALNLSHLICAAGWVHVR